jgi:hypothetical protein
MTRSFFGDLNTVRFFFFWDATMQNPKSQEPRPKQKRGRKRRILREEDDADDYNNVLSENDGDTSGKL